MESLGTLVDKLTIETNRLLKFPATSGATRSIERQIKKLKKDIDEHIELAQDGKVEFEEPKNKNYKGEHDQLQRSFLMSDAVSRLSEANVTLWDLEDRRRDTALPDKERLAVCDQVSVWNKKRNHYIDEVNRLFKNKFE